MCGQHSQNRGIYTFVDVLSLPNPLVSNAGEKLHVQ